MNDIYEKDRAATNDFGTVSTSGTSEENPMVTGLFKTREGAEKAYNALIKHGFTEPDINVLMSEEGRSRHFGAADDTGEVQTKLGSKALEGAGTGSAIGGTVGAVLAAIAAIGTSIALPGLGLIVAGPVAAALMGAGAGGVTGGLIGALVGAGIPEARAQEYETGIKAGGIVLGVTPRSAEDAAFAESAFRDAGGDSIHR